MERIYFKSRDIMQMKPIFMDKGTESTKYYFECDGIKYVVNIFQGEDSEIIKNKISKIENLSEFQFSKNIILPNKIVYLNDEPMGFTTILQEGTHPLSECKFDRKKKKIELLSKAKELVVELNNNGIIHSDILDHNFITDGNEVYLLDMLSCEFDNFKNYNNNFLYRYYLKNIGKIDENFDIYSFNVMTYSILYRYYTPTAFTNIRLGNMSVFEKEKVLQMYKRLLLTKANSYDDGFIIDEYQKRIKK